MQQLDEKVNALAAQIVENSPAAVERCKLLIQKVDCMDLHSPDTRDYLASEISAIRVSAEGQEGLKSFLEKRKPSWQLDAPAKNKQ